METYSARFAHKPCRPQNYDMDTKTPTRNFQDAHEFLSGYSLADTAVRTGRKPELLIADMRGKDGQIVANVLRGVIACLITQARKQCNQ